MGMSRDSLPFARGDTLNGVGYGSSLLTAGELGAEFEGQCFDVIDTVHETYNPMQLRAVRNNSGAAITVARKHVGFSTGQLDAGRQVSGLGTVGLPAKGIDDAYPVGTIIRTNDVFWVVESGPVKLTCSSTSNTLVAQGPVSAAAEGILAALPAVADTAIIGRSDVAIGAGRTTASVVVWTMAGFGGEGGTA